MPPRFAGGILLRERPLLTTFYKSRYAVVGRQFYDLAG
jgi:hypothetical protein